MIDLRQVFAAEIAAGTVIPKIREDLGAGWLDGVTDPAKRVPVMGVMFHYDASASDKGGLSWLRSRENRFGYNLYVWDDGTAFLIILGRAAHAGKTRSSDPERFPYPDGMANAAFISIAAAATQGDVVTLRQKGTMIRLSAAIFRAMGWSMKDEAWRLTDHLAEAWPRGRKVDVLGYDPHRPEGPGNVYRTPVIDMDEMRRWFSGSV